VADFPGLAQLDQRAERLLERHPRVDGVQLVEVDRVEAQAPEAPFAGRAQIVGPAVGIPVAGPAAAQACLRRDHEAFRIRVERVGDQPLAHVGAVGVGRVDEGDAELERTLEEPLRLFGVLRLAPDSAPGERHRAEADAADRKVAAEDQGIEG
jgi:hypothetical protein